MTQDKLLEIGIKIESSNGRSSNGKIVRYIHPLGQCSNKSRKVSALSSFDLHEKVESVISKWYAPMVIYYEIEGWIIGSNCKENALKEFWKICDMKDHGRQFEVKLAYINTKMDKT